MAYPTDYKQILFLDIETVPLHPKFDELDEAEASLWAAKSKSLRSEDSPEELYERAGIYAEFGKVVCISVGLMHHAASGWGLRIKSFAGEDELALLEEFRQLLLNNFSGPRHVLCAHNGKEFDFPFLARRMLINGMELPPALDVAGKKPWEIPHLDTMEMWKFGDFKTFTSLSLLAHVFHIPTPKDDITGADVGRVYWEEKDVPRIVTYCQKDVVTLVQVFLKLRGEALVKDKDVTFVD